MISITPGGDYLKGATPLVATPVDEWGSARMFNNWALLLQRRCPTLRSTDLFILRKELESPRGTARRL